MKSIRWSVALIFAVTAALGQQPTSTSGASLVVRTIDGQTLKLGHQDFAKLPPVHVSATDHDGHQHEYGGVNLHDVLAQGAIATGDGLRGKELADYIVAEGVDGYRVVFSVAELDPHFGNTQVIVAWSVDGQTLSSHEGPLRLVVPADKRQARWVRMLTTVSVTRAP